MVAWESGFSKNQQHESSSFCGFSECASLTSHNSFSLIFPQQGLAGAGDGSVGTKHLPHKCEDWSLDPATHINAGWEFQR